MVGEEGGGVGLVRGRGVGLVWPQCFHNHSLGYLAIRGIVGRKLI